MSTTVIAFIQQIPHAFPDGTSGGAGEGQSLLVDEIAATGEDYLSAVAAAESQVPEGWRVLYVRAEDQPLPTDEPTDGSRAGADDGPAAGSEEQHGEGPPATDGPEGGSAGR